MVTDEELDGLGLEKVQHQLDRGDWADADEIRKVKSWLTKAKRQREFLKKCERASVSSALDAKRRATWANVIAILALVVSVASLVIAGKV